MKRKENIKKSEVGSRKIEDKNAGMKKCRNAGIKGKSETVQGLQQQETRNHEPTTRQNSTVFHNSQFPKDSTPPVGEAKNPKGKEKKQLTPVIIDLPEDFAIRACDLLRFFNN